MHKSVFVILFIFLSLLVIAKPNHADEPREQYTVGVDDMLNISVHGYDNLKTTAKVTSDGSISFTYIGLVYVKGLTLPEIEKELTKRLSSYLKYPVVSVTLSTYKSMKFFVYGEVKSPGRYILEDNVTVLKAISAAGGITPDGLYGKVKLRRKQKGGHEYKEINLDLKNTTESNMNFDMLLEDEDIVVVERSKDFFIYGEVVKPGKHTIEDNMTVIRAISMAGGITPDGLYGKVKLRRKQKGGHEYKEINLDLKNTTESNMNFDMLLEDEDIVVVERSKDFFVYGEVMRPGKFTLEDNMTVLKAISLAGGFAKYGSPDRVKILRTIPGKVGSESIKVDVKGAMRGEVGKDIRVEPDDIVIASEGIL